MTIRQVMLDNITGAIGTIEVTLKDMNYEEHEALENLLYKQMDEAGQDPTGLHDPIFNCSRSARSTKDSSKSIDNEIEPAEDMSDDELGTEPVSPEGQPEGATAQAPTEGPAATEPEGQNPVDS